MSQQSYHQQHVVDRFIQRTSAIMGGLAFFGTIATLVFALPIAGAYLAGSAGLAAAAGAGGLVQAAVALGAGVVGFAAGFIPYGGVYALGKATRGETYGPLEVMTMPAALVDKAVNFALSPLKLLKKLSPSFKVAADKQPEQDRAAPENKPAAKPPAP